MLTVRVITSELNQHIDPVYKQGAMAFFKEEVRFLGVRTPVVRKLTRQFWKDLKTESTDDILALCDKLLARGTMEEGTVALGFATLLKDRVEKKHFKVFETWLKTYIHNWAHCDDLCTHALGALVNRHPELVQQTMRWTRSKNRWMRRAAAVVLVHPWRGPNPFLQEIFDVADALLEDEDDLVQKGYGWMLKVAADFHLKPVFDFVMERRNRMPRTALRYAIEKMPVPMKKRAMAKM